jgi:hypothetical protein
MEEIVVPFMLGALTSAAAFGAGLGCFISGKTLTMLAAKLSEKMEERQEKQNEKALDEQAEAN